LRPSSVISKLSKGRLCNSASKISSQGFFGFTVKKYPKYGRAMD